MEGAGGAKASRAGQSVASVSGAPGSLGGARPASCSSGFKARAEVPGLPGTQTGVTPASSFPHKSTETGLQELGPQENVVIKRCYVRKVIPKELEIF